MATSNNVSVLNIKVDKVLLTEYIRYKAALLTPFTKVSIAENISPVLIIISMESATDFQILCKTVMKPLASSDTALIILAITCKNTVPMVANNNFKLLTNNCSTKLPLKPIVRICLILLVTSTANPCNPCLVEETMDSLIPLAKLSNIFAKVEIKS